MPSSGDQASSLSLTPRRSRIPRPSMPRIFQSRAGPETSESERQGVSNSPALPLTHHGAHGESAAHVDGNGFSDDGPSGGSSSDSSLPPASQRQQLQHPPHGNGAQQGSRFARTPETRESASRSTRGQGGNTVPPPRTHHARNNMASIILDEFSKTAPFLALQILIHSAEAALPVTMMTLSTMDRCPSLIALNVLIAIRAVARVLAAPYLWIANRGGNLRYDTRPYRVNWSLHVGESALLVLAVLFIFVGPKCFDAQPLVWGAYLWVLQVYIVSVTPWLVKVILSCSMPFVLRHLSSGMRERITAALAEEQANYTPPMRGLPAREVDKLDTVRFKPQEPDASDQPRGEDRLESVADSAVGGKSPSATADVIDPLPPSPLPETSEDTERHLSLPPEDALCVICLEEYQTDDSLIQLQCDHHFHSHCLRDWLGLSRFCPMCKKDVGNMIEAEDGPQ